MIKEVALTYGRTQDALSLAKKYGKKMGAISGIASNLRALGVDVPRVKRAGIYIEVVDLLRKEKPSLILKKAGVRSRS